MSLTSICWRCPSQLTGRLYHSCDTEKKNSSVGGDCGSKKCKRGYGDACGGVWRNMLLPGVWNQAAGFVLVSLTVAVKMFSHETYFIKKLDK
jgi:hypothetical protein